MTFSGAQGTSSLLGHCHIRSRPKAESAKLDLWCCVAFKIRYQCGETPVGDAETSETLEDAHKLIAAKRADVVHKADIAIIFRICPSGVEELEESRKLHA
jgi:hypothetical protein